MLKLSKESVSVCTRDIHPCAKIGQTSKIHNLCFIEGDVEIGEYCVIKPLTFICAGTRIGNHVFIGPGTVFCNDKYPRPMNPDWKAEPPIVEDHVSIGANCTILPGVRIKQGAMIGAGSVVTKNVPAGAVIIGNPAKPLSAGN